MTPPICHQDVGHTATAAADVSMNRAPHSRAVYVALFAVISLFAGMMLWSPPPDRARGFPAPAVPPDAIAGALDPTPDEMAAALDPTPDEMAWEAQFHTTFERFGPRNRSGFLRWFADSGRDLPLWRPGRARPIVCDGRKVYAAYYGIPASQIAPHVQNNGSHHRDWSRVIPDHRKTYVFNASQEEEYTQDLRESRFAITFRKGGWQSARTLEILAAGCVPYFCDLWASPKLGSVANLPRALLVAVLQMDGVDVRCFPKRRLYRGPIRRPPFNDTLHYILATKLLKYTQASLNAAYVARYHLSATSLRRMPARVAVLWTTHPVHPGYLVPTFVMGLRALGVHVVDYPRHELLYADDTGVCRAKAANAWGKGYFSFCRLRESPAELALRGRFAEALAGGEFDAVVYHFPHESYLFDASAGDPMKLPLSRRRSVVPTWPFWRDVIRVYAPGTVMMFSDADLLSHMSNDSAYDVLSPYGVYFRRETHGCHDDIWGTRARILLQSPSQATLDDDRGLRYRRPPNDDGAA